MANISFNSFAPHNPTLPLSTLFNIPHYIPHLFVLVMNFSSSFSPAFQITPQDVSADVMWLYRESREQEQWLADYSNYHAGFTDDNGLIGWNNGAAARNLWQPAPMPTFEMQAIAYHQDQNGTMQVDTSVQMLDDNVFAMPQALEAEETNHSFQLAPNFRKEEHDEAIGAVYSAVVLQPKNERPGVDADIVDEAIVEEMLFDFKGDDSVEEDSA
ncbi:hypothetical protein C8Q75DRAFT_736410 [Abortiporus biennis]|nr:hypothetical protein C8Q75DRAFT_736410 [Abortiporus biennis]